MGQSRGRWIDAFFLLLAFLIMPCARAGVRISDFVLCEEVFTLDCPADGDTYYILLRGHDLTSISNAVDMGLGGVSASIWLSDGPLSAWPDALGFYAVRAVPLALPMDTDADGMDDVFELLVDPLNPLDAADAAEDLDEDGVINRIEYLQGRNLLKGAVQDAGDVVSLHVYTPLE